MNYKKGPLLMFYIVISYLILVGFAMFDENKIIEKKETLKPYNIISDIFAGGGTIYYEDLSNFPPQLNNGFILNGLDAYGRSVKRLTKGHSRLYKAYSFYSMNNLEVSVLNGNNIISGNYVFMLRFPSEFIGDSTSLTFGFWIDRSQLNGNGLSFKKQNGVHYTITNEKLGVIGSRAFRNNGSIKDWIFEVTEVSDNLSFISFVSDKDTYQISLYIISESGDQVQSLDIINPIMLDGFHKIDPYSYYKSQAEVLKSDKIGKLAFVIGDSQWQDRVAARQITRRTGLNILTMARGGHSIKYKKRNAAETNYRWFYHKKLRLDNVLQLKGIDYYILPLSTNDGSGGGDLSKESIQAVIDNYPYYGDTDSLQKRKLSLFKKMDGITRENIFGYKQTFAAYIMQLKLVNPSAKFILTSIPISPGNMTGNTDEKGRGVWVEGENSKSVKQKKIKEREQISRHSREIAEWFNTSWVDLRNKVGLTYENATLYMVDGVHWNSEIKLRIGNCISEELGKM